MTKRSKLKNNKLIELRLLNSMSQVEVAKLIGISKQYYNRIENNKQTGSVEVLKKLATFYGTIIDDLLQQDVDKNKKLK